jgi:hypothetical protein
MSFPQFIVIPPNNLALDVNEIWFVNKISQACEIDRARCKEIRYYYFTIHLRNKAKIVITNPSSFNWELVLNTTAKIDPKQKRISVMACHAINVLRNGVIKALPCEKIEVADFLLDPATMSTEQYDTWLAKAPLRKLEDFGNNGILQA